MKSKKGFTVLEVIIALSIIIIVSGAMFATINFSLKTNNDNRVKSFFINESENYISAYYLGEDKYSDAMRLLTGEEYSFGENATIYYNGELEKTNQEIAVYRVLLSFSSDNFTVSTYKGDTIIYECEA